MQTEKLFLCSELVKVSANKSVQVGNLELISAAGCTVTTPVVIPIGTKMTMQCIACPKGRRVCRECKFEGQVSSLQQSGPLGNSIEIGFTLRSWSPEKWQPGHLTDVDLPERCAGDSIRQ